MSDALIWLVAALALSNAYWLYCGAACARTARDARSFFLADRDLPAWIFVLVATGVSFPAWIVLGHAALVASGGLAFAETALCAITVPLAGVLFLKRQWILGRRYGYVTPAEMLGDYFGGEGIRLCTVLVAVVFAVPFLGSQMRAAADLVATVSGGALDPVLVLWVLTGLVCAYTCLGGMRAAAVAGASQSLLVAAGAIMIGGIALVAAGSVPALTGGVGQQAVSGPPTGTPLQLGIPGIMQFVRGLGVEPPLGSPWTTTMIFSYCVALMGLQLAPAFGLLAFATRSPKGFAAQQTWAAAGGAGAILVLGVTAAGLGRYDASASGVAIDPIASLIGHMAGAAPWFVGILAVAMLAGAQVFASLNLSAASTLLARDVYRRYVDPDLDIEGQRRVARIAMGLLAVLALLLATFAPAAQRAFAALALGFGLQLLPALAGLCWLRWLTREGVVVGLVAGLAAVVLTEPLGGAVAGFFGVHLPWGRWPWTLHSGAWGLAVNAASCLVISVIGQRAAEQARRAAFHAFLTAFAGQPSGHALRPLAWTLTLAWMFFAIGPGALYGNTAFGDGSAGAMALASGLPSLWIWQICWWALGVLLIWFLAQRMALSTLPIRPIDPLPRSQRPRSDVAALVPGDGRRWVLIFVGLAGLAIMANWLFD